MKTALVVLTLTFGMLVTRAASAQERPTPPAPVRTEPFPDVPKEHWAFDAVEQLRKLGILRGYPAPPAPRSSAKQKPGSRKPRAA
jgi:hypothetical protein